MKLMVPANYDESILAMMPDNSVHEVYGKLSTDIVGGGRPDYMSGPLDKKRLAHYVGRVQNQGLTFNYLLNSACLGNREWDKGFQTKLRRLLDWISETGITKVTVAIPYLAQIIVKEYPNLKFKVGIYAQVDTVKRAQYWEDLGATDIVLESFSINRNFELLKKIRSAVKCDLTLIANHFCQPNCPYQIHHQNGHAHASGECSSFYLDFPIIQCQLARLRDPKLMISAQWIRPEDIRHYEEIGYDSFKLIERDIPSATLSQRIMAYHRRRFSGNLADLIFSWGFERQAPNHKKTHFAKKFKIWKLKPSTLLSINTFMKSQGMLNPKPDGLPPVNIQADQIPREFIEWFKKRDCSNLDCTTCGFCAKVANSVIKINPQFLRDSIPKYEEIEALLLAGKF